MASPISNDKILPQTNSRSHSNRSSEGETTRGQAPQKTPPVDDTVALSNAGKLASSEIAGTRTNGNIRTPEQAQELVARIKEQITTAGSDAAKLHRRMEAGLLNNLLDVSHA